MRKFNNKKSTVKNFKRIETLKYKGEFYKLFINKNDSVYDIISSQVVSWKESKGRKVPNEVSEHRDVALFNIIYGNPAIIAARKVLAILEVKELS